MKHIPIRYMSSAQKEPNLSGSFTIRNLKELLDGKDMIQELHRHDFFFILALDKGAGEHEIDFDDYNICDRSVFVMRPGQVHQIKLHAGSTGYLIQFNTGFYYPESQTSRQLIRRASSTNLYQFEAANFRKLQAVMDGMFEEYSEKREKYQDVIKAKLKIFFIELIRQNDDTTLNHTSIYKQERLADFMELMENHVSEQKQVSFYTAKLNLSAYQLNAIAKEIRGKTSSELISEYILLEAKRYLLATTNQIKEIAFHLGYDDVSYFIRFFKKHTGFSPEAFRDRFT
ncbi:MAG: helix-turn-helix domain-containing protein [Balneolaceae bacterium]|nr:helix-turn-helix domain-containing protein [Balneolaceae bacterium]